MEHLTGFRMAGCSLCLYTPQPLALEPFFLPYRAAPEAEAVRCRFLPCPALPAPQPSARLLFADGMHRIYWTPDGIDQYFYIPYHGAPEPGSRAPDAWQRLDGAAPRVLFRPEAAHYFATACGCFNALKLERLLIGAGRAVLHASFIEWQGTGIAFTAPSGVGKSTQAALWERWAGAETVNGDRMAFGVAEGRFCGFGIPVAGSSQIFRNRRLPLRAVVLLEQGPENRAERETPARALPFLLSQTTVNRWDGAFMTRALELLDGLLRQVPVFRLRCRPDEGAVACLLSALEEAPAKSPG